MREPRRAPDLVVGVDFAGPAKARDQRRKILAVAAERVGRCRYAVAPDGLNARLLGAPPGWTAEELADALLSLRPVPSIVGADFPFCVPRELLASASFSAILGREKPFGTWRAFNGAVAARVPLCCPVDYAPFRGWRDKALWLKRASDRASGAHAPLKHQFQVLFNMTLLGNAFAARLERSGRYDVVPFQSRGRARLVEVYPGHAMRTLRVADYKRAPARAIDAAVRHLAGHGVTLAIDPAVRAACEAYDTGGRAGHDHDAADALVAACIAALHREGKAREIVGTPAAARDAEGAIWSF
jgi:hypothetical protein